MDGRHNPLASLLPLDDAAVVIARRSFARAAPEPATCSITCGRWVQNYSRVEVWAPIPSHIWALPHFA